MVVTGWVSYNNHSRFLEKYIAMQEKNVFNHA
jgi:hypothetical protein